MSSTGRSMAANTKAGRRNGSFKRSQDAMTERSQRHKSKGKRNGGGRSYQSREFKPDQRIYTVLISTRGGTAVYKAWEKNDDAMNAHFGAADRAGKRYFSFKDCRGKELTNVDLQAGWRYKMTLRWNDKKIARDGSEGDWQDIRQWYQERDAKRSSARFQEDRRADLEEEDEECQTPPRYLQDGEINDVNSFPSLPSVRVVINAKGEKSEPAVKIHTEEGEHTVDGWGSDEEETCTSRGGDVVASLEKEKAELLEMLADE